jgi:mannose-1-phosphate guanylyltransferase
VALVGVEDLIIVETTDALLICKRGASQDVRKVVDRLEREKRRELL